MILGEAERAARIVRNLLTFARKRQSTRMMVDVNDVVRETLSIRAYEQRVVEHSSDPGAWLPVCPKFSPTVTRSSRLS